MNKTLTTFILLACASPAAAQVVDPYAATGSGSKPAVTPPRAAAPVAAEGPARATVLHVPVAEATPGEPVEIVAVIDGAWAEPALLARYRSRGGAWQDAAFEQSSAGGWFATIPAEAITPPGAEYYIVGATTDGNGEVSHFASADAPQPIRIEPTLIDRLEQLDDVRLGNRRESVALDVDGHDFGNRYGNADAFVRAELQWTHRVSRTLHSVGFGFGSIWGRTPDSDGLGAQEQIALGRYGFAAVRVRAYPSVFVDGKLALGVSDEGFLRGLGGAVILGKPWRSNVSVGGEMLDDLGPTAFVRLQWDTAWPVLMGAAIVRTDLPDAQVSSNGLYIKYDAGYRATPSVTVRGALSYGSRDGAGRFGGGLGVQTDF
ncbi:MAG TPA: hypothetical protein VM261_29015 [Kofleriaceae bacterium]|nr:hypothetical protein [Kofleriaceae bacterium]